LSNRNNSIAATTAMAMKAYEMSKAAPFQRFRLLKQWMHFTVTDPIAEDFR
jgi:hypothetical protein